MRRFLSKRPAVVSEFPEGRLRFLGTAGFELLGEDGQNFALDPYRTRTGLARSVFGRLPSDAGLLVREIPG
jgi:hypothetical protein